VEEVADEPLYRDRVCGIDIGRAGLVATIRVPSDRDPARRAQETRGFGATRKEVLALADWLRCWQVPAVVMEATSDYWKGPFYRLEAEGFECVLADPRQVKNLPGRPKRDPSDSRWLAACFNVLAAPVEAAWRELDEADQAAAAIPARVPLGTLSPEMIRLDAEVKQITHAIRMAAYNAETALARALTGHYAPPATRPTR
jgi:transposase